jgi:pimeloyl-ACP methyl ester carboxylesterase
MNKVAITVSRRLTHQCRYLSTMSFDSHQLPSYEGDSIVFVHGMLGSKKNWKSASKEFVKKHPNYRAVAVDLRAHGSSNNLAGDSSVLSCGLDLSSFLHQQGIPSSTTGNKDILCGHSFGGKVVLMYAKLLCGEKRPLPKNIWIMDSLPGKYEEERLRHSDNKDRSVSQIISILRAMPRQFQSNQWAIDYLVTQGISKPIAQWLATSIVDNTQHRSSTANISEDNNPMTTSKAFSFNIDIIHDLFLDFCQLDMWHFLEDYSGESYIHFLQAGKNPLWSPHILDRFKALSKTNSKILLHTMPHVGHWMHAEDLHGVLNMIERHNMNEHTIG